MWGPPACTIVCCFYYVITRCVTTHTLKTATHAAQEHTTGIWRNQAPSGLPLEHSTLAAGGVLGLDDTLPGMGPIQDMVFYGGHSRYPNCTIHTLRVLNLKGHPASLRMDWETFKTVVDRVPSKQLLEVEASRIVCGWSVCCTARVFLRTQSTDLDVFDQVLTILLCEGFGCDRPGL